MDLQGDHGLGFYGCLSVWVDHVRKDNAGHLRWNQRRLPDSGYSGDFNVQRFEAEALCCRRVLH